MPPVFVTGLFTKLVPKVIRLRVLSWIIGDGRAIDEAVAELHLMTPFQPDQRVLDLIVELRRVDGQERRSARDPREVRDVDVRQAGRDLADVDAADAQRLGRAMPVVGLRRERLRARVADAELVDEGRTEHAASS